MTGYKEVLLGEEALRYLHDQMGSGHTLAQEVRRTLDLTHGCVRTFVPAHMTGADLLDFGDGVVGSDQGKALDWLVGVVREFLTGAASRMCVFEDAVARSYDPGLETFTSCIMTFRDDVYHVLWADEDPPRIEAAIFESSGYPSIGVMTTIPSGLDRGTREFSAADFKLLAENTEKVVVDAYDLETWLVWEREDPSTIDAARPDGAA